MDSQTFVDFRNAFIEEMNQISDTKSVEYTISNEDRLFNFKNVGARTGIKPEQALMTYVLKHMDAICNDAKTGKVVSDETILQRAYDVCNYMILYAALKLEKETEDKPNHDNNKSNESGTEAGDSMRIRTSYSEPPKWEGLPECKL